MTVKLRVLFIARGRSAEEINPVVAEQGNTLKKLGVEVDYMPVGAGGLFSYPLRIPALRRKIRESDIDIIHAHYGISGLVALAAGKRIKKVISYMGSDLLCINPLPGKGFLICRLLSFVNRAAAERFFDHIIVKSEEMKSVIRRSGNISVIPNGTDIDIFKPGERTEACRKLGWNIDDINIIFVSDPTRPEKNFTLAKKAVEMINLPEVRLHVVSGAPKSSMAVYYNAASILLLTSMYEGSPNVVKEAMSSDCTIVSTRVGDVAWLAGDCPEIFLTGSEPGEVADKLEMAIRFNKSRGKPGGRGRIVELGMDSVSQVEKIISVYHQLIAE